MSKEEAIAFLQEIKFNIDYLRAHYAQNMKAVEENAQQEKLRSMLLEQANAKVSWLDTNKKLRVSEWKKKLFKIVSQTYLYF